MPSSSGCRKGSPSQAPIAEASLAMGNGRYQEGSSLWMVTLCGTSDVSGVSGDDERESIVAAVVVDICDEREREQRAQRRAGRR